MSGGKIKGCWERGRVVGKYLGKRGERRGCWEGGRVVGKYLGKSGDSRLRIFPMFYDT